MRETVYKIICMAILFASVSVSPSHAWDFLMKGAFDWKYEYYSQLGSNGFFGPYDVSNALGLRREAAANGWLGIENHDGLYQDQHPGVVSGSDASYNAMKLELSAEFRLNTAVGIKGRYRIGGSNVGNDDLQGDSWYDVGPGFNTEYVNSLIPGVNNPLAYGEWAMLWLTAKTPWGILIFGKRPFEIGCGLQYNSEDATDESLLLVVPYGPLRFGVGFYPKLAGHMDFFDMPRRPDEAWSEYWRFLKEYYWPSIFWDKNGAANRLMAYVRYAAGPLNMGVGTRYTTLHFGSEGAYDITDEIPTLDQADLEGWLFAKYTNGVFFLNTEVDFFNRIRKAHSTATGDILGYTPVQDGGGSPFAPQYVEAWRFMVETGVLAGPAKLSLLYAYVPGPDRRHGVLIDRQPTTFPLVPTEPVYAGSYYDELRSQAIYLNKHVGNLSVFRPYSLLLAYDYGSGLNCQDLNGNGSVTDASIIAARFDYAAAANLNMYLSFLYAERTSHGWQWGCIWPYDRSLHFAPRRDLQTPSVEFTNPIPTIPDTALGWEIGFGLDWKLLENFLLTVRTAYWQPGRWFNYACVDRSVGNWRNQTAGNNWGVNPDRTIDPIFGTAVHIVTEF
jgi:hypothetical protein